MFSILPFVLRLKYTKVHSQHFCKPQKHSKTPSHTLFQASKSLFKMAKRQELMSKLFGDPLQTFGTGDPTAEDCARVWLSLTSGGVRLTSDVRNDLVNKLTKRLINHWTCQGRYQDFDFNSDKSFQVVRLKVRGIVGEVEKLKENHTKNLGNQTWLDSKRKSFQYVLEMESKPKENSGDIVEVSKLLFAFLFHKS